jgi:F0F1-type ATP synthase membrane subunit b/b'
LPQVVQKNESGYLSVDYAKVTPLLLMAIKEQQAEIETLKAQANAQKAEANTLKAETTQKLTDLENKMNAMLLLLNGNQEVTAKQ